MASARKTKKTPSRGAPGIQLGETAARAQILQGGARVFAERGTRLASVADILELAKISRRTFYRFYDSKEDVLLALYRVGTQSLLETCALAVAEESDPLRQLERCIDAHLLNARGLSRLLFVLGGEAQRHESALHQRRSEVLDQLVELLARAHTKSKLDPMLIRALLLALEGITRHTLELGDEGRDVSAASLKRAKRVMLRVAAAALLGEGPGVPPLPTL